MVWSTWESTWPGHPVMAGGWGPWLSRPQYSGPVSYLQAKQFVLCGLTLLYQTDSGLHFLHLLHKSISGCLLPQPDPDG